MVSPFPPDDERLAAVRDALPAVGAGIYLDTASAGPLPAETAAAMAELAGWELRTGRVGDGPEEETAARVDEARAAIAAVLTADVDEVAITASGPSAMAAATWAADWRPGDRAVTTDLEGPAVLAPLHALRERLGIELLHVPLGDLAGDDEATVGAFERALGPRVRLVSISHVSARTGVVLPVARIAELAHAAGALVAVDGSQAAGAIPVDAPSLGVDLYAVPGHTWLLGPHGAGALWVSRRILDRARPAFPAGLSFQRLDSRGSAVPWPDARRFDADDHYRPSIVGLARSVGWLSMYVGLDWVHRRGQELAAAAADRLASIGGVEVLTPRRRMATLVTFRVRGWTAATALRELGARVFAIARAIPDPEAIRVSVGCFNTGAELERFASAVELIAAHTPETIPARRSLAMLGEDQA